MRKKKEMLLGLMMVLPSFIIIITMVVWPILQSVVISFTKENTKAYTLDNYRFILTDTNVLTNIGYTVKIVLSVVVVTVAISYLFALYLNYNKSTVTSVIRKLYMIPRFIPGIVAVYAVMNVIKNTGALNRFLLLFGFNYRPGLMHTADAIILMNIWFNIPFTTMLIGSALADIPDSAIEGARDVGAGKWQILKNIVFPLSFKSVLIGAILVFMFTMGSFTTPFLMGENSPKMLSLAVYQEFAVFYNLPLAATLSVIMFVLSAVVGVGYILFMMKDEKWTIE